MSDTIEVRRIDSSIIGNPFDSAKKINLSVQKGSESKDDTLSNNNIILCKHEWRYMFNGSGYEFFHCIKCLAQARTFFDKHDNNSHRYKITYFKLEESK